MGDTQEELDFPGRFPSHWRTVRFPEVVFFQEGPGIRNWQYRDTGIPFVNIRCLVDGRLDRLSMNCLDFEEVNDKYRHFLLDAGDYVVSSSGTIGRLAEVTRDDLPCMLNTSVIRMRPKHSNVLTGISHVAPFSQVERGSKSLKGQVRWVLPPRSCPTTRN